MKAALHPVLPGQQACPMPPQLAPQPPVVAEQDWPSLHELPALTHVWVAPSQQPPLHVLPGQQACPEPPQAAHCPFDPHATPPVVQKLPDVPCPLVLPGQQVWPLLPHELL